MLINFYIYIYIYHNLTLLEIKCFLFNLLIFQKWQILAGKKNLLQYTKTEVFFKKFLKIERKLPEEENQ